MGPLVRRRRGAACGRRFRRDVPVPHGRPAASGGGRLVLPYQPGQEPFCRFGAMTNRDTEAGWDYHNSTKHNYESIRQAPGGLDFPNQPIPYKIYKDLPALSLPSPEAPDTPP